MKKLMLAGMAAAIAAVASPAFAADELQTKYGCVACHANDKKLVGPAYKDVAAKYAGDKDAITKLVAKVKNGGSGAWGPVPMPPHPKISDADLTALVKSVLATK